MERVECGNEKDDSPGDIEQSIAARGGNRVGIGGGAGVHAGGFRRDRHRNPARIRIPLEAQQFGPHLLGALVAQLAIFLQRPVDDVFQLSRQSGIESDGWRGGAVENGVENRG